MRAPENLCFTHSDSVWTSAASPMVAACGRVGRYVWITNHGANPLTLCEVEVVQHRCHAASECVNSEGSFECECQDGFRSTSSGCEDEDECLAGTHRCHADAQCSNVPGSFTCSCNTGFGGDGFHCDDCAVAGYQGFTSSWYNYPSAKSYTHGPPAGAPAYQLVEPIIHHHNRIATVPGVPPVGAQGDYYAVSWRAYFEVRAGQEGEYRFRTVTDDGVRLTVDAVRVIDDWHLFAAKALRGSYSITAQGWYEVHMQYFEWYGDSYAALYWAPPGYAEHLMGTSDEFRVYTSPSHSQCAMGAARLIDSPTLDAMVVNATTTEGGGRSERIGWAALALCVVGVVLAPLCVTGSLWCGCKRAEETIEVDAIAVKPVATTVHLGYPATPTLQRPAGAILLETESSLSQEGLVMQHRGSLPTSHDELPHRSEVGSLESAPEICVHDHGDEGRTMLV